MNEPKCLSEQELSAFLQGRIDAIRVEQIAEHLEACGDCQATVVMLGENSDTFVEQLRSRAAPDALEAEVACQAAVERLADRAADWRSGPAATLPDVANLSQIGPYRIQAELGVGGMGTVFEAVHSKLKRTVALKILPTNRWTNSLAIARFEREMAIIGQLDHPNIVRASDAGEENGMHYLVMEHVDGLDLSRIVSRTGPLSIADACEIARQAAIGLQYANENHLVHRDIKPSNLMLAGSGQRSTIHGQPEQRATTVKILDLGLALLGEAHMAHENELTTVGQLMGTLDYMSPEQGMDSHEVDIRADIYSLGATLYKLLTGRAPFASPPYNTLLKKVTALANKPVTPIQAVRSDIPDELAAIIDRMLAKEPEDRFRAPNELAAALEPFAQGADLSGLLAAASNIKEPVPKSSPPVVRSLASATDSTSVAETPATHRSSRRWKYVAVLVMLLTLFVFAAGIIFYLDNDKGVLIVEADGNAQISVRQDGTTVQQLEVAKGENAVTVRSGTYQIELTGQSDELMISQGAVVVKRGQRVVVRVEQQPAKLTERMDSMRRMDMYGGDMMAGGGAGGIDQMDGGEEDEAAGAGDMYGAMMSGGFGGPPAAPSKPVPTYDGKTYTQWLAELQTERKPERLTEAIRAFASLGEDDHELATRSASVIMLIMRRNGSNQSDDTPQGKLVQQAHTVLLQMPGEVVVDAIEVELREGNTRSRQFASMLLGNAVYGYGSPSADFVAAVHRQRESLYELLLTLPADELASIRAGAIELVIDDAKSTSTDLSQIEGLVPRLRAALKDKDILLVSVATKPLAQLDPDNKDLVPALIRLLEAEYPGYSVPAARSLGRLGARSQVAVPNLMAIIRPITEPAPQLQGAAGESAAGYSEGGIEKYGGGSFGPGGGMRAAGYGGGYGGYHQSQDIYYVAIEALGLIGPSAKAALPLLRKIAGATPTVDGLVIQGDPESSEPAIVGGGSSMSVDVTAYMTAARTASNRIEGKEPIPSASEQDAAAADAATRSGGLF